MRVCGFATELRLVFLVASALWLAAATTVTGQSVVGTRVPAAWDGCYYSWGKGGDCGPTGPTKPARHFEDVRAVMRDAQDLFASELSWDLDRRGSEPSLGPAVAKWKDIGLLQAHRIRRLTFERNGDPLAELLLAEGEPGMYGVLFKWNGKMPEVRMHKIGGTDVVETFWDFGGNVPMVETWAWVWGTGGPVRLDMRALQDAIHKVAPGHTGYATVLDWEKLHYLTYTWPENHYPGKVGVDEELEAWFELKGMRLEVKKVQWRKLYGEKPEVRHWP